MSDWKAKRFWDAATVQENSDGFSILLDGRPVRTPAKNLLVVPTVTLAEPIASEWNAQVGVINPLSMPWTRTANSALEKVAPQRQAVADMLAEYGDSDLICYRADAPKELVDRQAAAWDPLLQWAAGDLDAKLEPRTGVIHRGQDPASLERLAAIVAQYSDFQLAAFHDLTSITGSLVLALATAHKFADDDNIWRISRVDEDWQVEQWGEDDEASVFTAEKRAAFVHAAAFFRAAS
jgi:chaperone required for assembly of F1-ATPase